MSGFLLQLRTITNPFAVSDYMFSGEWVYDTVGKRIVTSDGGYYSPLPTISTSPNAYVLEAGYGITSYDRKTLVNWSTPNTVEFYNNLVLTARFSSTSQQIILAADGMINRTGPQSLENFFSYPSGPNVNIHKGSTTFTLLNGGNIHIGVDSPDVDMDKNVTIMNLRAVSTYDGVRNNLYGGDRSTTLYSRGTTAIKGTSENPYFDGITMRSYMYYPYKGEYDLTFYAIYRAETTFPIRFTTRIGWEGNWQYFTTILPLGSSNRGPLAFHFEADQILAANKGKTMTIEWVKDLICTNNVGTSVARGVALTCLSVFPGYHEAKWITPTFLEYSNDLALCNFYSTQNKTVQIYGRTVSHVNFDVPLISDNYEITAISQDYAYTITSRTRFGFTVVSSTAPSTSYWNFTYKAICK